MPSPDELKILNLISKRPSGSQRDFAAASGFSLGLTNAIIKRLARTGYIKVKNLNSRKMSYILTPKGLSEKSRKTRDYILNTIKTFQICLSKVKAVLEKEIADGKKHFIIVGKGNIAELSELALKELKGLNGNITFEKRKPGGDIQRIPNLETVILDCRFDATPDGEIGISMLSCLLEGTSDISP